MAPTSESYQSTLNAIQSVLAESFRENSKYEAEELLSRYLNISIPILRLKKNERLDSVVVEELLLMAHRRSLGEPVQYILGWTEFLGIRFKVNSQVLIPRLDSEAMVLHGREHLKSIGSLRPQVLDLGAGSGALGLALISECPEAELCAAEISEGAVVVLTENTKELGLSKRVKIFCMDLDLAESFKTLTAQASGFDVIVANPPYIERGDADLDDRVGGYEPEAALYAENQGLGKIINWSQRACNLLSSEGLYLCEIGWKQAAPLAKWFEKELSSDYVFEIHKDLSERERYFSLKRIDKKKDV